MRTRTKEIVLRLDAPQGKGGLLRRLTGGETSEGRIRLVGTEIVFEHPAVLQRPLTIPAGLVAVATVDRGSASAGELDGRFPILHRMGPDAVIPASEGVEGWLWTQRSGSALPSLVEAAPNLALVFVKPLEHEVVTAHFDPAFVSALAARSPLGTPTVFGLLARVSDAVAAESAFAELGVDRPLTDREVAPAQRRHLPTDRRANPAAAVTDAPRKRTSIPPPGAR
ncbi:MAG TPA: hypothetical protein VF533_15475 [Solirubrobacteraceae bacterium]|jgi:hypothetical protein